MEPTLPVVYKDKKWNVIELLDLPILRPVSNPTVNRMQSKNTLGAINSHSLGQFFTEKLRLNTPYNSHCVRINTFFSACSGRALTSPSAAIP